MTGSFAELFLEAMRYEHWLRFYFLEDKEGYEDDNIPMQASSEKELRVNSTDALLVVPAEISELSREEEPALAEILDVMQGQPVSMERSRDVIFTWLGERTGIRPGSEEFESCVTALTGDKEFRRSLDGFHGWVQELANNEIDLRGNALPPDAPRDERIPSFAEWDKAFQFWFSMQKPFSPDTMRTENA